MTVARLLIGTGDTEALLNQREVPLVAARKLNIPRTPMLLFAVLVFSRSPQPWSPKFESQHLTNQTIQSAFASHPPLRAWVHAVIHTRTADWHSVDDLLNDYVSSTTRALFLHDVVAIDTEYALRQALERKDKEVLRLNPGKDPNGRNWDTEGITQLKEKMSALKIARVKVDPSGGLNYSRAGIAAPA